MEDLQHDPRTKQQLKDTLFGFLYDPIQKQFKMRLDALITKNTLILGAAHNSFMYKGTFYSCDAGKPPRKMNYLVSRLYEEMNDYLKEVRQLNNTELPYVLGFITQVLNASNDMQDYLRILPSALHNPIHKAIASCPCRSQKLSEDVVAVLQDKNKLPIEMIKRRMVTNLLL